MYATAVGLVMNNLDSKERSKMKRGRVMEQPADHIVEKSTSEKELDAEEEEETEMKTPKSKTRFFEKFAEKFKDFLDNAE